MDERTQYHRLKSTSLAGIAGAVAMGGWTLFQLYRNDVIRKDLFAILILMALVKVVTMFYLKRNN